VCSKRLPNRLIKKSFRAYNTKDYESNLLIIPSSIHECIVIPTNQLDMDVEEATEIVKAVNTTEVPEEEILSDHVYIFNRDTSKITW